MIVSVVCVVPGSPIGFLSSDLAFFLAWYQSPTRYDDAVGLLHAKIVSCQVGGEELGGHIAEYRDRNSKGTELARRSHVCPRWEVYGHTRYHAP